MFGYVILLGLLSVVFSQSEKNSIHFEPLHVDSWERGHELPDIVAGRIFSEYLYVRVRRSQPKKAKPFESIEVRLSLRHGSSVVSYGPSTSILYGQPTSLHARIFPPELNVESTPMITQCPYPIEARIESPTNPTQNPPYATATYLLQCKKSIADRFTFVYLDFDGSPQIAAAKLPKGGTCNMTNRCDVLVSTHGMDVTAQRQADCYKPKANMWILAPHGRGTHGWNWQGPGHWSVEYALSSLMSRALSWNNNSIQKVIFTGHSNGGYGAWFFGTHYPDLTIGVAPLSGMHTLGTLMEPRKPKVTTAFPEQLWKVYDATVAEYRGERLAKNIVRKPFLARAGMNDQVIAPWLTQNMLELFQKEEIAFETKRTSVSTTHSSTKASKRDITISMMNEKEHWWWDTVKENDGGVMDDLEMKRFWRRAKKYGDGPVINCTDDEEGYEFVCVNPASCGPFLGIQVILPRIPTKQTRLLVRCDAAFKLHIQAFNVEKLRISFDQFPSVPIEEVAIGETIVAKPPFVVTTGEYCYPSWSACSNKTHRTLSTLGPLRRVFSRPFVFVYGTKVKALIDVYLSSSIEFSKLWHGHGGGVTSIVSDTEFQANMHLFSNTHNVILLGGPSHNSVSDLNFASSTLESQPIRFDGTNSFTIHNTKCTYDINRYSFIALLPHPWTPANGLVTMISTSPTKGVFQHVFMNHFLSELFVVNRWQHRVPEFVVVDEQQVMRKNRTPPYRVGDLGSWGMEVEAAGWWGSTWEYVPLSSFNRSLC
eukprot:PhF_6_TR26282/c0_g1_i1/m.37654